MRYTILRQDGTKIGEVSDDITLTKIKEDCPGFFKTKHGQRETHVMYRGQLIVRSTVFFSDGSRRKTAVYLYFLTGEMENDTFCISAGSDVNTIYHAKRLIDRVLDGGVYYYGIRWRQNGNA